MVAVHGSDATGTESISGILGECLSLFIVSFLFLHFEFNASLELGTVNGKLNSPKPGGGARSFTFKELAGATRNFREVNLIGEGGFGRVYKGRLDSGEVRSLSLSLFLTLSLSLSENVILS